MTMNPVEEFSALFERMYQLCEEQEWGDPFSYARSREIHVAGILNHQVAPTLSGPDGFDNDGACEYKSTVNKNINGAYNGISVFPTWDEQVKYLAKEKIKKYKNHYFSRYNGGKVAEIWKLSGEDVFNILLPKLERKFSRVAKLKDPRLGATVTKKEIYKYGTKIYNQE